MEALVPFLGVAIFALLAIFFGNGVINVYLSSTQRPHHLILTHEAILKVLIALVGLCIGAVLKYGISLSRSEWEHVVFVSCIVAGLGALAVSLFNLSLISKARGNTSGRRGARLADVAKRNVAWCVRIPLATFAVGVVGSAEVYAEMWSTPLAILGTGLIAFCAVSPSIVTKVASKYATDQQFGV